MKKLTIVLSVVVLCIVGYLLIENQSSQSQKKDGQQTSLTVEKQQQTQQADQPIAATQKNNLVKKTSASNNKSFSNKSLVANAYTPSSTVRPRVESNRESRIEGEDRFDQPDMFAKIQKMIRTRDGESEPTYKPNYKFVELAKMQKTSRTFYKGNKIWFERGPANVGGRTRGIVIDASDATNNTWFCGSVGGGIWKTTDAGTTWRCLTDLLPNLATTTLDQCTSNPNVLYAGTGEGYYNADAIVGDGVFKSTDKGETWTQLSATSGNKNFAYVNRIVCDPNNENVAVAGTRTGIFKTIDGGTTWVQKSTTGNIDQIIKNPLNFNTLYAAVNNKGVLKSFDAGDTWFETDNKNLNGGRMEIAIAPSDTSRLYVSSDASSGSKLFGTVDGGLRWGELTEQNTSITVNWLGDQGWYDNTIAVNPYDAKVVYVGGINLWKATTSLDSTLGIVSVEKDSIDTKFSFVPNNLPFENGGVGTGDDYWKSKTLADSDLFSVELRFGPGKSQKAARFINTTNDYQDYITVPFEVWDINNNRQLMASFQDVNKSGTFNYTALNGDRIHIHAITYDSTAADVNIAKANGIKYRNNFVITMRNASGVTWDPTKFPNAYIRINVNYVATLLSYTVPMTDAYNQYAGVQPYVHPDQHNIVCIPTDNVNKTVRIVNGNDGGVALSNDGGASFKEVGDDGYITSQFYGADKMTGGQSYLGGMQDNGTYFSEPSLGSAVDTTKYKFVIGGDGFEVVWNPKDSLKMIGGSQYNGLSRTVDGWKTRETPSKGFDDLGDANNSPFITKIAGSKQDPDLLFVISRKGVYRSDNFAADWVLTPLTNSYQSGQYFTFAQVVISNATPQVVWAGVSMSSTGKMQVSKDGGLTFNPVNNYSQNMGVVSGFDTDPVDPATAYATFSYQGAAKIIRTTNYGNSWTDITGFTSSTSTNGFPNVATYCVLVMPFNRNIIWAGTEIGIIESTDNGVSWHYYSQGFPAVAVWDMKIVDDEVVVATHGRGIWSAVLKDLANYKPLPVTLSPRINGNIYQGKSGIIMDVSFRSEYDSSQVFISGSTPYSLGATPVKDSTLIVPYNGTGTHTFQMVGYKNGVAYKSGVLTINLIEYLAARNGYVNDFNAATTDFIGDLTVSTPAGFQNGSVNSPHPYGTNKEYIYTLRVPIVVAASDATLKYDDVAIVEPGDPGSVFGDNNFWDYVVVEGSKGSVWFPLGPGYDCRADAAWLTAYNNKTVGTPAMYKTHTINLLDYFKAGDEALIRFRLFADQYVDSWGWAIDNLKIQETLVDVKDQTIPTQFELSQNYPNPFNPTTIINYALPKEAKVTLKVYDNVGQLVGTLVNAVQPAGRHSVNLNAATFGRGMASGVYFYRIEAGDFIQTKKLMLIK